MKKFKQSSEQVHVSNLRNSSILLIYFFELGRTSHGKLQENTL